MSNCKNCGAPATYSKCAYCGTYSNNGREVCYFDVSKLSLKETEYIVKKYEDLLESERLIAIYGNPKQLIQDTIWPVRYTNSTGPR